MKKRLHIGVDVGSTTVKIATFDKDFILLYQNYQRHFSDTKKALCDVLQDTIGRFPDDLYTIALTGSGAISAAKFLDLPFIQEVVACKRSVEKYIPQTDVAIELGGEDAKIIYFEKSIELRMNGTCAGGTGAFIDQMASLLHTNATGLNELAKNYKTIHPIASRCGVFAKTDIQALLNEGAAKEDIAASIFQAIVNQTISGLACGRPISGNVAFLGGPLNYLSELRQRFIKTLGLEGDEIVVPKEAHIIVAKGAAIDSAKEKSITSPELNKKIANFKKSKDCSSDTLNPLFANAHEYDKFKKRHDKGKVKKSQFKGFFGDCYIGIDAGSTTSKLALIDSKGRLLYSNYGSNEGNPLKSVIKMLKELYAQMSEGCVVRQTGVTGYGEKLIQTALKVDINEIETIAHYTAAKEFLPEVTSIVDIGGQDMKYIRIKDGNIENIMLNEACSSGCGSFIETFAKSLDLPIEDFVKSALKAKGLVDLGYRCTVFMNSKIKQAQKEGYSVGEISAGLSYSIVKNALQKVMKIRDVDTLGDQIVVQGGTFYNDAVLRAFEKVVGRYVVRPDIAGLMGAYGVALLAKEAFNKLESCNTKSTILDPDELDSFEIETKHTRCKGCENHCLITINKFVDGICCVTGNRCEKGEGVTKNSNELPNLVKYKYDRIFDYEQLSEANAPRGVIGVPRVLNMYEDYPFWITFLTHLGFRVIISGKSTRSTYERGIESMPSESVCYPAKLSHGHIMSLLDQGIKTIFYPCIPLNRLENNQSKNTYNCPIVTSYPEVLINNIEELKGDDVTFINPFLPFSPEKLAKTILGHAELSKFNFTEAELIEAAKAAEAEYQAFKADVRKKGEEALAYLNKNNKKGIVLAGRPYHMDPEVNHGIDTMITSLGLAVLTEDSICQLCKNRKDLRAVDQWSYHSRLYSAADVVGHEENLELVQLNSFGCGVDAVTTDQVEEILSSYNKMYTLIKIDEINNLGAMRIRIRSLLASMNKRLNAKIDKGQGNYKVRRKIFDKDMRKKYTILVPQLSPIHFELIEVAIRESGYNAVLLRECTNKTVKTGLKYVNNDACYPSILVVGQMIEALESGNYDLENTALVISQTGGGCRATNYISFIRKALKDAGYPDVPVISFNVVGMEKMPGFKIRPKMIYKLFQMVVLGDLMQKLSCRNRAYEVKKGETDEKLTKWMEISKRIIAKSSWRKFKKCVHDMILDFETIELDTSVKKPRVGIVGEILIKYHSFGNNHIVKKIEEECAEVVMPDLMGFVKFMCTHKITLNRLINEDSNKAPIFRWVIKLIDFLERGIVKELKNSKKDYMLPVDIFELEKNIEDILSIGNQTGEGWYLTAE
ncbi:MAG: 2-hydroxyacyl-CoA dehydratase, partial [Eggerthellaceae bacterium]|nr:2-hydroxyacyl-CoA dehydratase [Eggerthellaceae bacterium]